MSGFSPTVPILYTIFNLTSTSLIAPLNIVHTLITDARIIPEVARQMSSIIPHVVIAPLIEGSSLTSSLLSSTDIVDAP